MPPRKPIKILMLEDSVDDVIIIERTLRKSKLNFIRKNVDKRDEFIDAVHSFQPDVILSDHALPGFSSREALKIARQELGKTPFILVSGTASDDFAATVLRAGADDYIPKADLTPLPDAIRLALKKREREKRKREKKLALRKQYNDLLVLNQSLESFAYTVSFHLRNPLTSAMGLLNLAAQYSRIEDLRPIHQMMGETLTKMDETLKGLLEYAKNNSEQVRMEIVSLESLIPVILRKVSQRDRDNKITHLIHVHEDVPFSTDPERLAIVLTNVLRNSVMYRRHTPQHEPIISIEAVTSAEHAVIIIKDNGTGIPAALLPQVYNMFFRGTQTGTGSGLGLYVARHILWQLGGTIDISSDEGVGTTVRIELPNGHHSELSEK